ncbi:MAG: LysE family translocator [Syntrophobacterales bacterium]|nr:MAG: LysE family translocator [Syntrophobacterales bacterium]
MSIEIWAAFVCAAAILLVIPGPTILLVLSQALTHGRKSVVPLVAGVVCGDFTAMTLSLLGLGAILSASAILFTMLKWIGAVYLVYLGVQLWRSRPDDGGFPAPAVVRSKGSLFKGSFIVTALNPKSIVFFIAFLPQFVDPKEQPQLQLLILGATFLLLAGINATLYAIFADNVRDAMRNSAVRRWFTLCGGTVLIGAGALTVAMQRSS